MSGETLRQCSHENASCELDDPMGLLDARMGLKCSSQRSAECGQLLHKPLSRRVRCGVATAIEDCPGHSIPIRPSSVVGSKGVHYGAMSEAKGYLVVCAR